MELFDLIQTLVSVHGPSGDEGNVCDCIAGFAAEYADDIRTDALGNLIVHIKGDGPSVMFAAHMDSIGFIVTHIEEDGYLRAAAVGGIPTVGAVGTPVRFKNGVRGVFVKEEKAEYGSLKMDDCCIDIGACSAEEAASMVQVGDTAVYDTLTYQSRDKIFSRYLDNRIACAILLSAMSGIKNPANDLYFVFTVQEEVGLRGAQPAAWSIDPEYAVAVDVTFSDDAMGSAKKGTTKLGRGAAIKVMDAGVICHPTIVKKLSQLAEDHGIDVQREIIRVGRTDAAPIHLTRSGICTGGISIPCRYMHSPIECIDLRDASCCIRLVSAFASDKLDHFSN